MSASQQLPLTVTYTPQSGVTTTVTVLGQVLNNGATNWVPTQGHAIYLATTSEADASQTVLQGETYYLTTGPAVPDQATGVTISVAPTSGSSQSSPAQTGSSPASPMSSPASMSQAAGPSRSSSAAPSSTSPSSAGRSANLGGSSSKAGYALGFICVLGMLLG